MEPEFPSGCIIVIEPDAVVKDGSYVVAIYHGEPIFRRLHILGERWQLHALQPGHEILEIPGLQAVRGRVVQRAGRKRSDRKRYD